MNVSGQFPRYTASITAPHAGGLSLLQIRDFVTRQWRLIALVTALSVIVGIAYLALTPRKYTALTDMIIDTKRVSFSQSELATENRIVEDASVESEIETTKSEKVAGVVARRLQLATDPEFVGSGESLKQRIFSLIWSAAPAAEPSSEEILRGVTGQLRANLRVTRLGRSYIEQIAYTSLDPTKAARIANAFADAYIEDQLEAKFEATRRASIWLEQRIGELRKQASDAFKEVQDFKSQYGIIIGVDGKLASDVELDQLGMALAKARAETSQAKAKLDRIQHVLALRPDPSKESLNIPDPIVTDALSNPVITKLRQQFLDDQNKESEWSARYGGDHQAARNLRAEMAALQRAIWDEISRIAESYKSEVQIAKAQEDSIERRMNEVFQQSGSLRQSQVRLRELETASNTYRNIYETFLSRFTQSVQQQSFPSTEARVVTYASAPAGPSSPKKGFTLALATLCGLSLGVALAIARERMSRQIHTRAQLEELLGTSCLAVFPALKRSPAGKAASAASSAAFKQIAGAAPFSATAEALRYLKVAIDLHPKGGKIVGMISALPGEGKTTVAASLADFLAKSGNRTLLIDADLRNPSLSRMLGYAEAPGLLDVVANQTPFGDLVITDSKHRFDFLPSATRIKPSNSSDILSSPAMKQLLKSVKSNYDYVLIDLPPILPVVDVKATAHLFEAFLLIVEWGATSTDEVIKAVSTSSIVTERLLGAVLNKADEAVMRRFEGYSDRSYGYYSDEKPHSETV